MTTTKDLTLITNVKGVSFWAKRFDEFAHIVKKDATNVGGGVYCGKFGALLGSNYASDLTHVCPECLAKLKANAPTPIRVKTNPVISDISLKNWENFCNHLGMYEKGECTKLEFYSCTRG